MTGKSDAAVMDECLKEMFRRVGLEYPCPEITSQEKWWTLRTWTEEEERDFSKWMKAHLKKNFRGLLKKVVDYNVGMFLLSYGWTTKEGGKDER